MSKMIQLLFMVLLVLKLSACGAGDTGGTSSEPVTDDEQVDSKPLPVSPANGFIRGQSWSFKSGRAVIFRSGRTPVLEINAYSKEYEDPCDPNVGTSTQVRILVAPKEDTYELGSAPFDLYPNLFFIDYSKFRDDPRYSLAANGGRIQVVAIRSNLVIVRVESSYRGTQNFGKTEVSGQFAVPLCR